MLTAESPSFSLALSVSVSVSSHLSYHPLDLVGLLDSFSVTTVLIYVYWSANIGASICWSILKSIVYKFSLLSQKYGHILFLLL